MPSTRTGLLFLGAWVALAPVARAGDPSITCMEMLQGVPQVPVVYTLRADGNLVSSNNDGKPISSFKESLLSVTSEGKTWSVHAWIKKGETLRRTVRSEPHPAKNVFHDVFDFKRQTIKDDRGEDWCHHDKYKPEPP